MKGILVHAKEPHLYGAITINTTTVCTILTQGEQYCDEHFYSWELVTIWTLTHHILRTSKWNWEVSAKEHLVQKRRGLQKNHWCIYLSVRTFTTSTSDKKASKRESYHQQLHLGKSFCNKSANNVPQHWLGTVTVKPPGLGSELELLSHKNEAHLPEGLSTTS